MVVYGTRLETPLAASLDNQLSRSMTVIDRNAIEQTHQNQLSEVLNDTSGLDVSRQGSAGGFTSVMIRGGDARHTLLLLDGIVLNDPISPAGTADLGDFSLLNIERVEIVRGSQTVLYGPGAVGGVIHLVSQKNPTFGPPRWSVGFEGGAPLRFSEHLAVDGGFGGKVGYSLGVSRLDEAAVSASGRLSAPEIDAAHISTAAARFRMDLSRDVELDLMARYTGSVTDLDNGPGGSTLSIADDPNHVQRSHKLALLGKATLQLLGGGEEEWEQQWVWQFSNGLRKSLNDPDSSHPAEFMHSTFQGSVLKGQIKNKVYSDWIGWENLLSFGADATREQGAAETIAHFGDSSFRKSVTTAGGYVHYQLSPVERLTTSVGTRLDFHPQLGSHVSYQLGAHYWLWKRQFRIRSTVGTGNKPPSLFQLYSTPYGNPSLRPEESTSFEIGVDHRQPQRKGSHTWTPSFELTYFLNRFHNLTDFVGSRYENVSEARSSGLEWGAKVRPWSKWVLALNYTYSVAEDLGTGEDLIRRPRHKGNLGVGFLTGRGGRFRSNVRVSYVGKRGDTLNGARVGLPPHFLLGLMQSMRLDKSWEIYGRIENLLNLSYESVVGYQTLGRAAYVGLQYRG